MVTGDQKLVTFDKVKGRRLWSNLGEPTKLLTIHNWKFGSGQTILKDALCLKCIKSRLVSKFLNFLCRVNVCETSLYDYWDHFKNIITGD